MWVDVTNDLQTDILENSTLRWDGGDDHDTMHVIWSNKHNVLIEFFDDMHGINDLNIDCGNTDCTVLSRENLLINIHDPTDPQTTSERITLVRHSNARWDDTDTVNTIVLRLNGGDDVMYFDDTFAPINVFGGPGNDGTFVL